MGREIAHVMGHQAADWLERPERQKEERADKLLKNMQLQAGYWVLDVGAGTAYHSRQMAEILEDGGVYALDIQREMLARIEQLATEHGLEQLIAVKGDPEGFALPDKGPGMVDRVLMVDVYHEMSHPVEMMRSIREVMREDALLYLVEFRLESAWVPIKKVHKMSEDQAVKEMEAAGFSLSKRYGNLPWQHCLVFEKSP